MSNELISLLFQSITIIIAIFGWANSFYWKNKAKTAEKQTIKLEQKIKILN